MIGYLDIPSGISGDMFLGCLVDAGWPIDNLRRVITAMKLHATEWSVEARPVMKGSMRATLLDVQAAEGHFHRHLADIRLMIESSDLSAAIKARAVAVFQRLANAEAKVHGSTPEAIHFHEVGGVDAIIDIVGTAAGLAELGIDKLYASPVPLGAGWAPTQHGQIPLPGPATLELLAGVGAPTRPAPGPGEWVTPTGAALLAEFATFEQPPMSIQKIGIGAGRKDAAWPNIARLWLGQPNREGQGTMVQLQTNIDDMNPQLFAAVAEKLMEAGASDVWLTPIQMKKNRPGVLFSVLAKAAKEMDLANIILRETTTLGVRVQSFGHRHEAKREIQSVQTAYGPLHVKLKYIDGKAIGAMPEYEDCKAMAAQNNVAVRVVWEACFVAAQELLGKLTKS